MLLSSSQVIATNMHVPVHKFLQQRCRALCRILKDEQQMGTTKAHVKRQLQSNESKRLEYPPCDWIIKFPPTTCPKYQIEL